MPRLYLELIENKAKIKQDLINKEYIPPSIETPQDLQMTRDDRDVRQVSPVKRDDLRRKDIDDDTSSDESAHGKSRKKKDATDFESRLDKLLNSSDDDLSSITSGDESLKSLKSSNAGRSPSPDSSARSVQSADSSISDLSIKESSGKKNGKSETNSEDSDDLSIRLKELLKEDGSDPGHDRYDAVSPARSIRSVLSDKYSRHRDARGYSVTKPGLHGAEAPTLSELEQKGGYVPKRELRDISQTTNMEQREDNAKRELLFKFDLLKKSYPHAVVPEFTVLSDLSSMQKSYDDTVRRLSLDSSVENYKTYLVYGFMGCEFVFGNFLGFDMQGFTQQQIVSMNSYEKLLIELGEKSYVPTGSKWPVELRLLFLIIMNAAIFVISKMIMKKTGANLMGMINNMQTSAQPPPQTSNHRKRKMRGPNIDLGDIPDLDSPSMG
jgi:hypothetical protein